MKTILVDAWNTLVTKDGFYEDLKILLDTYQNRKIILTNANDEQIIELGLVNLPYELFTLKHNPDKIDPGYFVKMLKSFNLSEKDVIYFEHNPEVVKSAQTLGIISYHYDKDLRDLILLKEFLDQNL